MKSLTLKPVMNKNMPKQIRAVAHKIRPEKLIAPLVQGYFNNDTYKTDDRDRQV